MEEKEQEDWEEVGTEEVIQENAMKEKEEKGPLPMEERELGVPKVWEAGEAVEERKKTVKAKVNSGAVLRRQLNPLTGP